MCAYVENSFSKMRATTFKMAATEGQHIEDLQGEKVFRVSL